MFCVKCGNAISETARFCKSCGNEIVRRNRTNQYSNSATHNPAFVVPPTRKKGTFAQPGQNKASSSLFSSHKLIVVGAFSLVIVIVAAVTAGVLLSGSLPVTARLVNIHSIEGDDVTLARELGGRSVTPRRGQSVHSGNVLNTGRNSFVYIQLDGTSLAKMDKVSRVAVSTIGNALALNVQQGELFVEIEQVRPLHTLQVLIGHTTFSVRGTSFIIGYRANAVFVTMLSGEGAMSIQGVEHEVTVLAGQMLVVPFEREDVEQAYFIHGFDINEMSLFELREIYRRRDMLLGTGVLTLQHVQQLPERMIYREAVRVEVWARENAMAGIEPTQTPTPPPTPAATTQSVSVGDIIPFGNHDWRVLDVQGNRALIITEYVIGLRWYHYELTNVTWETSDIRRYLNSTFLNSFSEVERRQIIETTVINSDHPWDWSDWSSPYWYAFTPGGNNTIDKIFLLTQTSQMPWNVVF